MRPPWIASLWNWNRRHILIACFPKSGSTYLSKVLQELTGYPEWYAAEPGDQNEQDFPSGDSIGRGARRSFSNI